MDGNGSVNPRRTSTESIGVHMTTSSRAIFETPQAEVCRDDVRKPSGTELGCLGIKEDTLPMSTTVKMHNVVDPRCLAIIGLMEAAKHR